MTIRHGRERNTHHKITKKFTKFVIIHQKYANVIRGQRKLI